jgi:hypothetical protein
MTMRSISLFVPGAIRAVGGAVMVAIALGGCAADAAEDPVRLAQVISTERTELEPSADEVQADPPSRHDETADLPTIVAQKSNGTGCPSGSVMASLAPDRKHMKIDFSFFEAAKPKNQSIAVKDCLVTIKLASEEAFAYTLEKVALSAFVLAEPGVDVQARLRAGFQGPPTEGEVQLKLSGPFDGWTTLEQDVSDGKQTSPCGVEHTLTFHATARVQGSRNRSGYINLAAAVEQAGARLTLAPRRCD